MNAPPTIAPDDELVTTTVAARELGIHRLTLTMRLYRGELPFREVPGRILIRRADLDAYKASQPRRAGRGQRRTA